MLSAIKNVEVLKDGEFVTDYKVEFKKALLFHNGTSSACCRRHTMEWDGGDELRW